jgi:DNA-binding CsgD family transcriptional regulator
MREEGNAWAMVRLLGMAGLAHLSSGDVDAAAKELDEAIDVAVRSGVQEPGIFRVSADAVEALVAAGRLERAEEVLQLFELQSQAVGRRWGIATAARCRALLAAARGHSDTALDAASESVRLTSDLGQPFEHARSLLVAGTIERRVGRRRDARDHLAAAQALFEHLGADSWAARAVAELGRISGRARSDGGLTPTEERVAALVAEGLTNQEVAARLFMTVRTVETNLTRIYQKLEIRSRTELARRMATGEALGAADAPATRRNDMYIRRDQAQTRPSQG